MNNPEKFATDYQRELFTYLYEFFKRATGQSPTEFATVETFSSVIRGRAEVLGKRAQDAYPWAEKQLRQLHARAGAEMFRASREIGGVKLVLGGSSRFNGVHLNSVRATLLYADTVLIPDPVMPWLETPREGERFRFVSLLKTAFTVLHLKPIVDADLGIPAVVVFPSWEKLLEEKDAQTQNGIYQLITDVIAHYVEPGLQSVEDVKDFVERRPDKFLKAVEEQNLFVAPGGGIGQPLTKGIAGYQEYVSTWRSKEWLERFNKLSPAQVVLNCITERVVPQYHLIENAEELRSHPLLCVEEQAHYYRMLANTGADRLQRLSLLSKETRALIDSLSSRRFTWLANVPIDALVELRQNNENAEFRERLIRAVSRLHDSALEQTDRVTTEVCHEILALTGEHRQRVKEIESKYWRTHGKTAVAGWAAIAAMFFPSLAPFLGTVAPLALAAKYASDKMDEIAEKKKASKSLMGVLSLTKSQDE